MPLRRAPCGLLHAAFTAFTAFTAVAAGVVAAATFLPARLAAEGRPAVPIPPDHYSRAELSSFKATPSYEETLAFLRRLERTSPFLKLDFYGRSAEGREMPVVIVSKERSFGPAPAATRTRPVVLILNAIHAGETDGKDACLMILRDLALGNRPELLDAATLVVVPIYNVDGHERVSRFNRPNQNGPEEGTGFRTTTMGLDLNRDFLKADAPETRALLALASRWQPDLFVDDHVTDGADFQATLTLAYENEAAMPAPLAAWLKRVVPRALARVKAGGYETAPYVEWVDAKDPSKGIDAGPPSPRYSTGYFPLRLAASILVETHAVKPTFQRVRANELFLVSLLEETGKEAKGLLEAREALRAAEGRAKVGSPVVVDAATDLTRPEKVAFPAYAWRLEKSPVTGQEEVRYDPARPVTVDLPLFSHARPNVTIRRPAAYLVPAGWPAIEARLSAHGVPFRKLTEPVTLDVGTYRAREPKFADFSYQGRVRVQATIAKRVERRTVPAGSLYVPLDHDLSLVAIHLLEPEAPDSLFQWGEMSAALEQKEYIDLRVLDPIATRLLAEDPKLAAEWAERLKDPVFAASRTRRIRFFYERTPYWDETLGLLPVYRLERPLSAGSASGGGPG